MEGSCATQMQELGPSEQSRQRPGLEGVGESRVFILWLIDLWSSSCMLLHIFKDRVVKCFYQVPHGLLKKRLS